MDFKGDYSKREMYGWVIEEANHEKRWLSSDLKEDEEIGGPEPEDDGVGSVAQERRSDNDPIEGTMMFGILAYHTK